MVRRLTSMLILCLSLGLWASQAMCEETVKLVHTYVPGQVSRYRLAVNMDLTASAITSAGRSGIMPVQVEGIVKQQVKRVAENGDAEIFYSFESMKVGLNHTQMSDLAPSQMPSTTMIVSRGGEVKAISGTETVGGPLAAMPFLNLENLSQYSSILPAADVKLGDKWSKDVPYPAREGVTSQGAFKAEGKLLKTNVKLDKYTTASLQQRMSGTVRLVMPIPPSQTVPGGAKTMDAESSILSTATNYFSPELGRMVFTTGEAELRMSSLLSADSKDNSRVVNVKIQMTYKLALMD